MSVVLLENRKSVEQVEFKYYCEGYGYSFDDYNKELVYEGKTYVPKGKTYVLKGFRPRARKYPIIVLIDSLVNVLTREYANRVFK